MPKAPIDSLLSLFLAQLSAERLLVESFLERLVSLCAHVGETPSPESLANVMTDADKGAFADLLFEAIAALEDHAGEEERFIKSLAFGHERSVQYERHSEDHASLAEAMCLIVEAYALEGTLDCARRLHQVLTRWRHDHIDHHDTLLLDWLNPDT